LNKVQFDSMAFQKRNGTCGMKPEHSGQNLAKKSGTDQNLKWDEICSILFCFLNWYEIFRLFWTKQNEIDNLCVDNSRQKLCQLYVLSACEWLCGVLNL